jgi:hypothetical protein
MGDNPDESLRIGLSFLRKARANHKNVRLLGVVRRLRARTVRLHDIARVMSGQFPFLDAVFLHLRIKQLSMDTESCWGAGWVGV